MRTTLTLDDDVVASARKLAAAENRSLGSVISELVRRGLERDRVAYDGALPLIRDDSGAGSITPEHVRRALGDD